ncbi:hypothetical protein [Flavobacterium sp.]|uniref:hypothetical protein n=1 Tax=Flavobacterium sp. TaxID=239 RepID=UPI0025C1DDA3|nr:hypothetical protein [Flavobacterium sp.]
MSSKIGIYITGLGQSANNESIEKYAERLRNELSYKSEGTTYITKIEKTLYHPDKETTVVSIFRKDKNEVDKKKVLIYKIYDFPYHKILTDRFQHYNIIVKNLILFGLILKKIPQIIARLFIRNGFDQPVQTFYAFLILFTVSACILLLIPGCIELIINTTEDNKTIVDTINKIPKSLGLNYHITPCTIHNLAETGKKILSITTLLLLFVPQSKTIITSLATEFSCVDSYIVDGEQSQILLGNLDLLVEHIAEKEPDCEIHFHTYSFGSILAIDALFPIAEIPPSSQIQKLTKLLITIGNPFEFIDAYYPSFYRKRCAVMSSKLTWLNVYSVSDVFATNYRRDDHRGKAEFGIKDIPIIPENINYEITSDRTGLIAFFSLNSMKMHRCYWDSSTIGQSCIKVILPTLLEKKLITT